MSKTKIGTPILHAPHLTNIKPSMGLGDAVEKALNPITKTVDKVFGSNLTHCVPCHTTRKDWLNKLVPDITKPLS